MRYSKDVVIRARAILAQRKSDRESENASRLQHAYKMVPRLQQIDMQLSSTMAIAAQAAFSQGMDAQIALEQARQENLALQAERKALEESHFSAGYLDGNPVCSVCADTGYIGSSMCSCLKELCLQEHKKDLGSIFSDAESFETFLLEYYSEAVIPQLKVSARTIMQRNLEHCQRYARTFSPESGNLLLNGGTGLGKTHLALAVGKAVGEQGYNVCYETAISLFSKLEKAKFTPTDKIRAEVEKIETCDLLIIDDLGTEMSGQFVTSALYGLLNERLQEKKPMIITTNLNVEDAGKRYSAQIASRLYGEFKRLTFLGSDIRILKNRGL